MPLEEARTDSGVEALGHPRVPHFPLPAACLGGTKWLVEAFDSEDLKLGFLLVADSDLKRVWAPRFNLI